MFPERCPTNTSQAHFTTLLNVSSLIYFGTCDYSYFELSRYINETTIVRIKVLAMKLHRSKSGEIYADADGRIRVDIGFVWIFRMKFILKIRNF